MNLLWDIQAKTYDSAAAMRAEADRVRRRVLGMTKAKTPPKAVVAAPEPAVVPSRARKVADLPPKRDQSPKDAHVEAFREWQTETAGTPCKAHIMSRARDFGLSYADIIGQARSRKFIIARHTIMWEIKRRVKPDISFPELGRVFGGRDHTSCLFAVKKMDVVMGWAE